MSLIHGSTTESVDIRLIRALTLEAGSRPASTRPSRTAARHIPAPRWPPRPSPCRCTAPT